MSKFGRLAHESRGAETLETIINEDSLPQLIKRSMNTKSGVDVGKDPDHPMLWHTFSTAT